MDKLYLPYFVVVRLVLLTAILALSSLALPAQTSEVKAKSSFWLNVGTGVSMAGKGPETQSGGGGMGRIGLGIQKKQWMLRLQQTSNTGGPSRFTGFLGGKLKDSFLETSLMPGYVFSRQEGLQIVGSAGLSLVHPRLVSSRSTFFGQGTVDRLDPVLGVPIELGLVLGKKKWFRFGMYAHMNFNSTVNFFNLSLCGNFGWFRD